MLAGLVQLRTVEKCRTTDFIDGFKLYNNEHQQLDLHHAISLYSASAGRTQNSVIYGAITMTNVIVLTAATGELIQVF